MTGKERLARLRVVLEDVRGRALPFDMRSWFKDASNPADCATAACAGGWAARDPLLQAEGLSLTPGTPWPLFQTATGSRLEGYQALAVFFNVSGDASEFLFCPWEYKKYHGSISISDVLQRLDEVEGGVTFSSVKHKRKPAP